jgi:hypothetical protein
MICGRTLFVGPIIALSLLPGITRSAVDSAPGPASTTEEKIDQPTRRPAVEISDDATATWRRSHNETAANIRFIKPSIPGRAHAAARARALVTDGGPSSESIQGYRQRDFAPTKNVSVKRIEVRTHVVADYTPAKAPAIVSDAGIGKARPPVTDRQLAGATAAKLQQLIELPKPQLPAAIQSPNQPADVDGAIAVCATNEPTQFQEQNSVFIKDEPDDVADKQVVQAAASAPRQLWAAGTRLLQGIGKLFPVTGSRSTVAQ